MSSNHRNTLASDVEITGTIKFSNDLIIDGKIDGEVISDGSLTIGENATIKGEVKTKSVVVFGKVNGNIEVKEHCDVKKDAQIAGDIKAGTLSIEGGASFVGQSAVGPGITEGSGSSSSSGSSGSANAKSDADRGRAEQSSTKAIPPKPPRPNDDRK